MKLTIKDLEEQGLIVYKYIRGSHLHGLNVEGKSDIDVGGVYIAPFNQYMGLREDYQEQITDEKGDTVYYEFGRWIELLLKGNIQAIESLFVPEDQVLISPAKPIRFFIEARNTFLTRDYLSQTYKYAKSQIKKARGLNKMIVNPVNEKKDVLDFCYTFRNQGSQPFKKFLVANKLNQKYCGLVNIPNMKDIYGVYYDFAAFFHFENIWWLRSTKGYKDVSYPWNQYITHISDVLKIEKRIEEKDFYKYEGIVNPEDYTKSNDVRLSSVHEGDKPIAYLYYNKDGYTMHCKDYRNYKDWEKHRNPVRYESNLEKNFDGKNLCECVRLINTALEFVETKEYKIKRTDDRQFLLDIKEHKMEYDEIISYIEKREQILEEKLSAIDVPESVDREKVKQLATYGRKWFYIPELNGNF